MTFFTVCIPTYNRSFSITRTLESLEKQSFDNFEILVIDDGSTDNTKEIIQGYSVNSDRNIRYYSKENGGKHSALNVGIEKAEGQFFIILDSDDMLDENALINMKIKWEDEVDNRDDYCGVMGKCATYDGKIIGKRFPYENFVSSYVDFHFGSGFSLKGNKYGDCCECIRTDILKKYSFPENKSTKFVPEAYIMDKIGLDYKLLCTNTVYEYKEYLADGITKNNDIYKNKNIVGYIYKYVSTIDDIIPNTRIPFVPRIISWWQYWRAIKKDPVMNAPRCKKITFIGYLTKFCIPVLDIAYKALKRK